MNKLQSLVLAITLLVGGVSVATAQDYQRGMDAYKAGDYVTAIQEWTPLAEQGNGNAQWYLGVMSEHGQGILQDYAAAFKLYSLAAKQGDAYAQYRLGNMYQYGDFGLQDNVMSHMWYNIASANGVDMVGKSRDELAGIMTSADISKAQAMARECMSSNYQNCGW